MNKMIDWLETNLTNEQTQQSQPMQQDDVQELEEEQEVQEVEMFGEDDLASSGSSGTNHLPTTTSTGSSATSCSSSEIDELVKLSTSASIYYNQQKQTASSNSHLLSYQLDNGYLVHLLAINKIENVFRVKQIHDYYGGCFVCGKQVEFNMKHYQTHFNAETLAHLCLHCNYKEYHQEAPPINDKNKSSSSSSSSSSAASALVNAQSNGNVAFDENEITQEETILQTHMTQCHNIDFNQILQQHQHLQSAMLDSANGVVVIESTPMNDMYLSVQIKSIKYIDDDLLRKDEFRADMLYSCPICTGDINVYNNNSNASANNSSHYTNYENVTFEYLMNHFLLVHQFKAVPLFVCAQCNCARVSLIDCVYHYIRHHFNKKITIGLCAYNIYDKIQMQLSSITSQASLSTTSSSSHHNKKTVLSNTLNNMINVSMLPLVSQCHTIYGSGPLIYCNACNENYSNEASFIRHSYLAHLLDPNINLNWYKVYTSNTDVTPQQIAAAMAMADLAEGTVSLVDSNGQAIDQQLVLMYECPMCFKSVQSKESIQRHLIYHAINENYEYDLSCSNCTKQLSLTNSLAECLLHCREFKSHRIIINFFKFVLSTLNQSNDQTPVPMVACVLCNNESSNILSCVTHIMQDHFTYDSSTVRTKRFVNYMLTKLGVDLKPKSNKLAIKSNEENKEELVQYFNEQFPSLINELIVSLITAANNLASGNTQVSNNKPDLFFQDIKCFKCGKFGTKSKQSLFEHLNQQHGFDMKELEKLYENHIQKHLQVIDEQQLVAKFDKQQKEVLQYQQAVLKESKEKSDLQIQQQKLIVQQQQQQQHQQLIQTAVQSDSVEMMHTSANTLQSVTMTNDAQSIVQYEIQNATPAAQNTSVTLTAPATIAASTAQTPTSAPSATSTSVSNATSTTHASNVGSSGSSKSSKVTASQANKIDSTIDQVLSQICRDDYELPERVTHSHSHGHELNSYHNHHQHSQQITVQAPEAENLFVFKCNLCEPYSTDDATQLLEHYKLMHQVELTIADSSTLLAAAVAAFQTGHTIEMTGAILNTISSVTDENGVTIISGEEVPVHTTVQYKCTLCQMIFYEKQYIVQHLFEAHNFEVDISYFEEIETQQQEQLQQKIYEQQQEQLMLQQQQIDQQQQQQQQQQQGVEKTEQMEVQQQHAVELQQQQPQQQQKQQTSADETAAVMMMMMNGSNGNNQPIILQANQIQQLDISNQIVAGQILTAQPLDTSIPTAIPINMQTVNELIQSGNVTVANATPTSAIPTLKQTINYSCTYCTFVADKLKKMSDHLKQSHPLREKTCMDNVRQQLIRLPNEDLPPYNQSPATVGTLLQQQQQLAMQQHQQQQQAKQISDASSKSIMDNLSSSLINLTTSLATATNEKVNQPQTPTINHQVVAQATAALASGSPMTNLGSGKKRGPKPKQSPKPNTIAAVTANKANQLAAIKSPTILTMDANSQIIIDFNQNDDLLCTYCDYTMNNLNYMRTHIKYKHKNMSITFQNKVTSKYYTIVEWPLTPVPTLTPASEYKPQMPPSGSSQQPSSQPQSQTQQPQQTGQTDQQSTQPNSTTEGGHQASSGNDEEGKVQNENELGKQVADKLSSKENQDVVASKKVAAPSIVTQAGGITINTSNVSSILKKLGVNSSSPLTNLLSTIGSGTKTVNNSVVNVNLNVLKDVNIDDMIDDDDDEERKFLIKELEKKANVKKQPLQSNGYTSDGSASGDACVGGSTTVTTGGIKRSRSSSSTTTHRIAQPGTPTSGNANCSPSPPSTPNQMNITLNCHYCWAQFQLNVTKNSVQQKENGKYMQHLALHLNAPYKCNECSYPITDTKTFLKHKQFYKHDEKTCIMVDNDVQSPGSTGSRRKCLIPQRLKQQASQQQQLQQQQQQHENQTQPATTESNEIQFVHDRDSFKCSLCYADDNSAPSTSVSTLNKSPTGSSSGASNFSFDKEQVLKHVLIVHLSFLAYKCDTCPQFYAFDEPQTKQHAALVHHCGAGLNDQQQQQQQQPQQPQACHFKLIKTEEEINLAINRAQQFITKIPAQTGIKSKMPSAESKENQAVKTTRQSGTNAVSASLTNSSIEAQPKYKCCKCSQVSSTQHILYTYQDALDHVMNSHMIKKDNKKVSYELELYEQNLEELFGNTIENGSSLHGLNANFDEDDFECEEESGELVKENFDLTADLAEWNVILSEPVNISTQQNVTSPQLSGHRKKRFKTNNNTSLTVNTDNALVPANEQDQKKLKRFYFKPYLIYKCMLCSRKMNEFDVNHWLQHDQEHHEKLFNSQHQQQYAYQQITYSKTAQTNQSNSKIYTNFSEFYDNYKKDFPINEIDSTKLVGCLICGTELKCTYIDVLKHFQSEHEFNIFSMDLNLDQLELIHTLQTNNQLQLSEGVHLRRRCNIRVPPLLINPNAGEQAHQLTKIDLIDKEINYLNEIYREQIVEKQIVSWLNSEQFFRRNFNYNSHVCIICNTSKTNILESHYNMKKNQIGLNNGMESTNTTACPSATTTSPSSTLNSNRLQYYSDEMKTVVLTNHVLSHFNEYCYRCMSCKISWPDRTQLLKHAQECSNSQVVRTKTKYKLKANCRLQLKFYLQTFIDYWNYEKCYDMKQIEDLAPSKNEQIKDGETNNSNGKLDFKVFLKDIIVDKELLLSESSRCDLNTINLDENKQIILSNDENEQTTTTSSSLTTTAVDHNNESETQNAIKNDDVEMK